MWVSPLERELRLAVCVLEAVSRLLHRGARQRGCDRRARQHRWNRKDWWFPATEAAKYGFIDEVR
jgi:ATP-dependent protease ClpP protease subunit